MTSIKFVDLVIKDRYVDLKEINYLYNTSNISLERNIKMERISDLPYLIIEISDINNLNYGTNNDINKASFILKYDDDKDIRNNSGIFISYAAEDNLQYKNVNNSILPETNNKTLYFKNFGEKYFDYENNPKGVLKNMKILIKTPNGKVLGKMNNYLNINKIDKDTTNNLFIIKFDKYFHQKNIH